MRNKILFFIFFAVGAIVCTTCYGQLDVKSFIEKGFSAAKFTKKITFSHSTQHNGIDYLLSGSGEPIQMIVPIGNDLNQAVTGSISIPPESKDLFSIVPKITTLTPNKAVVVFQFKENAEPSAPNFIATPIPLLLTLMEKTENRPFGSLAVPLYCNSPPVKPEGFTITYHADSDSFTFPMPAKIGIHQDLDRIEATVTISRNDSSVVLAESTGEITVAGGNGTVDIQQLFKHSPVPAGKW
ncbi:MAG: hypothetical protein ACTTH8_04310 [Treponema sp.]